MRTTLERNDAKLRDRTCAALTQLSVAHLPQDGSLGRLRRVRNDFDIWQADDLVDRIYFLQRGEVAIFSGDPSSASADHRDH